MTHNDGVALRSADSLFFGVEFGEKICETRNNAAQSAAAFAKLCTGLSWWRRAELDTPTHLRDRETPETRVVWGIEQSGTPFAVAGAYQWRRWA